jgi:hypothetical protein
MALRILIYAIIDGINYLGLDFIFVFYLEFIYFKKHLLYSIQFNS